jgi:uncharacterized membrane protein YjfL (UPF0719 family)
MNFAADLFSVLDRIGWELPLFLVAFGALWITKVLYQRTEPFHFENQLTERDNPAFGTALSGYLLGATLALTGAFPRHAAMGWRPMLEAAGFLAVQGLLVAVLMRFSLWVISRGVMYSFGVSREMVRDRNVGAGAVVAGGCVAAGLVLQGALSGNSDSPWLALRDVFVFWAVGMGILVAGARLHCRFAFYNVQRALEQDNAAAGFSLGGFLAALGIVVHASVAGASSRLGSEIVITLAVSAVGVLLLLCSGILAAKVFLPKSHMIKEIDVDRNLAVGLLSAVCSVSVAILLAHVIAS